MKRFVARERVDGSGVPMVGPNGRRMHRLLEPVDLKGRLFLSRYLLLRRASQIAILLLFFGTAYFGWTLAGKPLLAGNLSGSEFAGVVPMADPYAVLQILFTGNWPELRVLLGALVILALYGLLFGRAFCSWVCPLNMVTDLAAWLRRRFGIKTMVSVSRNIRYTVLGVSLVLSSLAGVAAFEWISPIGMLQRELLFGAGMGWMAVLGVFILDLVVMKNAWCGHLCPLGAFYSLIGRRTSQLVVRFDRDSCTHCGECADVCPESQVLNLKQAMRFGQVGAECTSCGRCVSLCPENSLRFDLRRHVTPCSPSSTQPLRRTP